ncbi:MAG: hypothetical protein EA411_11675 [Saprospirales bacterium]|nr:MAG: hypothetical protein EA411_11675 [Saprospirales bacterium]
MTPEEVAERRVKKQKKFYDKLGGNLTAILVLFIVNYLFSPGILWSLIPIAVLGIDIVFSYIKTFGFLNRGGDWEYLAYRKELRRLKRLSGEEENGDEIDELDLDELREKTKEKRKDWDEQDLV